MLIDDPRDLSTLSIAQSQHLADQSRWLRLDSLASLPADVAAVLARHEGGLAFGMLSSLSAEAEDALAGRNGELKIPFLRELKTRSLAAKLAGQPSFGCYGLQYISDAAAEGLVTRAGPLDLDASQLRDISQHTHVLIEKHATARPVIRSSPSRRIISGGPPIWASVLVILLALSELVIAVYAILFVPFQLHVVAGTQFMVGSLFWPMCRAFWPYYIAGVGVRLLRMALERCHVKRHQP